MKAQAGFSSVTGWIVVASACISLLATGTAMAQTIYSRQSGNWSDTNTWTGFVVPSGSAQTARPTASHKVTITGAVAAVRCVFDTTGGVILTNDASLVVGWGNLAVGASYHHAWVKQYAGSLTVSNNLELAYYGTPSHGAAYHLYGGTLEVGKYMLNGARNDTVFNQYGGMMTITGQGYNASMIMPIFWGTLHYASTNIFNQYGGTNRLFYGVLLARGTSDPACTRHSELNLYADEQRFAGPDPKTIEVAAKNDAANRVGIIRLSTATNQFVWKEEAASGAVSMQFGRHADSLGMLRGWGDVEFTGSLENNGMIIADGWATNQDRTLDLSTMASVTNAYDNTGSNGWYAVNRGKLMLPALTVPAGVSTQRWGESSGDTTIDLVNSVELGLTGVSAPGLLSLALLATNHSEFSSPTRLIKPVTVWKVDSTVTPSSATLRFRYDPAAAGAAGVGENDLRLFAFQSGNWRPLDATVDTGNKWITATGVTSLSPLLAIAEDFIPSGTVITVR